MKKLLIAFCLTLSLTACNSGSGGDSGSNEAQPTLVFTPAQLIGESGQVYSVNLSLVNPEDNMIPLTPTFKVEPESAAAVLTLHCYIGAPYYNCNLEIEKTMDYESEIVITPVLDQNDQGIQITSLIMN